MTNNKNNEQKNTKWLKLKNQTNEKSQNMSINIKDNSNNIYLTVLKFSKVTKKGIHHPSKPSTV